MKLAVIDLGTNTFSLLIANCAKDDFTCLYKRTIGVKLGEGGIEQNIIRQDAFNRGINALVELKKDLDNFTDIIQIIAIGTSAIRGALNKEDFIQTAFQKTGIKIEVIDGDREAELIYKGVNKSLLINEPLAMIDISGGSTEFILTDRKSILWKKSYLLGVSRLKEKFPPSNPMTINEVKAIESYIESQISELIQEVKNREITTLVGVSGPYESYVEMMAHQYQMPVFLKGYKSIEIEIDKTYKIHDDLVSSSLEERLTMKGLVALRADMMVISSIYMQLVQKKLKIRRLLVSSYSLREGVVYDSLENLV